MQRCMLHGTWGFWENWENIFYFQSIKMANVNLLIQEGTAISIPRNRPLGEIFNVIERKVVLQSPPMWQGPPIRKVEGLGLTPSEEPQEESKITIPEMFQAIWPKDGVHFLAEPSSNRLICSMNNNFSSIGCSYCAEHREEIRKQIATIYGWLMGYNNKCIPLGITPEKSWLYHSYTASLNTLKQMLIPFIPPSTPEEIQAFETSHHNVRRENEDVSLNTQPIPSVASNPSIDFNPSVAPSVGLALDLNPNLNPITDLEKLLGPNIADGSKRFYLNAEGVHLTYPYKFDPIPYIQALQAKFLGDEDREPQLVFYSVVNETGDTEHEHTHAALLFNRKYKTQSSRCFDYKASEINPVDPKSCHPNIQAILGKASIYKGRSIFQSSYQYFANVVIYHRKQGTPVTNVTEDDLKGMQVDNTLPGRKPMFGKLNMEDIRVDTVRDLIAKADEKKVDPRDIPRLLVAQQIIKEYEDKIELRDVPLNPIQQFLSEYAKFKNDRVIIWVADEQGGSGKTYLATHMYKHSQTFVTTSLNEASAIRSLKNYIDKRGEPNCIIIDLSRSTFQGDADGIKGVYHLAERLKGQVITSSKYDSTNVELKNSPTVMILSNSQPKINMLSLDRWVIFTVGFIPDTFEYAFVGKSGELSLTVFRQYIADLEKIDRGKGVMSTLVDIIQSMAYISNYPGEDKLRTEYLMTFWDRGVAPQFTHIFLPATIEKPQGEHDVKITEIPLTEDRIAKYKEWKSKNWKSGGISQPALDAMRIDLNKQANAKLATHLAKIQESQALPSPSSVTLPPSTV